VLDGLRGESSIAELCRREGINSNPLSAGGNISCGLTSGGEAYCWGDNGHGAIGDGTSINSNVPVAVLGGLTFESLSAGIAHSCGLTTGGDAYCWGWNWSGELGDGTYTDSNVPVLVLHWFGTPLSTETPPGEGVVVQPPPEDENGNPIEDAPDISLTFGDVLEGGDTTVVVTEPGAGTTSAPSGFKITGLTGAPVLFDIDTTAVLAEGSTFEVCFNYSGMDVAGTPDKMALMHEVDGKWTELPTTIDTTNFIICGEADSFSYFAIVEALEVLGPTDPLALGTIVALGIDVGEPAYTDSVIWGWGDGLTDEVAADQSDIATNHMYGEPGVYTVRATLIQGGLEAGYADFQYVVVYDPTAGFVTGGGWFNSLEGAYLADPSLIGKATFGFVPKYKKGAIIPTGNTEFQFKTGGLTFRSLEYQWLVIAGARAQFKGTGTVNGLGNFGFMLTAVDEALTPSTDLDWFRIKIWDRDSDTMTYDNGLGINNDGDPITAIEGGSIVIHKAKK
jgi:hypothetical protein